jgi:hypothetical protein
MDKKKTKQKTSVAELESESESEPQRAASQLNTFAIYIYKRVIIENHRN